jgi:CheY-like chemotaxis protein
LQKFGYRSDVVSNGLEVLNVLERQHYDLILMDLHMPEMDGIEAAVKIQQRFSPEQLPRIVAMTANVLPGDRDACRQAGMQDFLAKPINLDHLYRILDSVNSGFESEIPSNSVDGSVDIDFERLEMIRATPDDGEGNLLTWVIDTFITDVEARLSRMRAVAEQSDWRSLAEEAHRFYSSASNLGLIRISNICIEMELQADNSETSKIELLEQLAEACERVLPELERQKSLHESGWECVRFQCPARHRIRTYGAFASLAAPNSRLFLSFAQSFDDNPSGGVDTAAQLDIISRSRILVDARMRADDQFEVVEPVGRGKPALQANAGPCRHRRRRALGVGRPLGNPVLDQPDFFCVQVGRAVQRHAFARLAADTAQQFAGGGARASPGAMSGGTPREPGPSNRCRCGI